jgi:hypothetical protein
MKTKNTNRLVTLLTQKEIKQLRDNYTKNNTSNNDQPLHAFEPVVKLFNPTGMGTWYLSELSPDNIGFGICQLQEIELGYVSLDELSRLRLPLGRSIEKDRVFLSKGQTIYQLCEALQTGEYAYNEQQIALLNIHMHACIEKKATALVENHVSNEENMFVNTYLEKGLFTDNDILNLYFYYDQKGNKHSIDSAEKSGLNKNSDMLYDREQAEIFTWYPVTDWLSDKLSKKGEPILNNAHGTWWGRTIFGQPIIQDEVIKTIAKEYL